MKIYYAMSSKILLTYSTRSDYFELFIYILYKQHRHGILKQLIRDIRVNVYIYEITKILNVTSK